MANTELLQVTWNRDGLSEDVAVTTHHFRAHRPSFFDFGADMADSWDGTPRREAVEARFETFWNAIRSKFTTLVKLEQFSWYEAVPNGQQAGQALRTATKNIAGTSATGPLPPQVACSITERTSVRKRWGRFYLTGIVSGQLQSHGRFSTSFVNDLLAAAGAMYDGCVTDGAMPVVYSRTFDNSLNVGDLRIDDIPDIIRRRRFGAPLHRVDYDVDTIWP